MSSTSVVADFEAALQYMQNQKPPGVSGSKIGFLTDLSVNNVQSESVIIQKLYTHFKRCPGTHKMGPLYAVDSIVRKYIEHAKKNEEQIDANAPDGTYAAGVIRIQSLLPMLMVDILQNAPPEENKDKIEKLYSIWERSETFPPEVLADIKNKMMNSPMFRPKSPAEPTTPTGSPPQHVKDLYVQRNNAAPHPAPAPVPAAPAAPSGGVASILQMMAQMSKANQAPTTTSTPAPAASAPSIPPAVSAPALAPPAPTPIPSFLPPAMNGNPYPPSTNGNAQPTPTPTNPMPYTSNTTNPAIAALMGGFSGYPQAQPQQPQQPPAPAPQYQYPQQTTQLPAPAPSNNITPEHLQLLQLVMATPGLASHPSVMPVLATIMANLGGAAPNLNPSMAQAQTQPQNSDPSSYWTQQQQQQPTQYQQQHQDQNRPRGGYSPPPLSPPRRGRTTRTRSRSPERFDDTETRSPKFRRRSPIYGEYDGNDAGRGGRGGARGGAVVRGGRGGRGGARGGFEGHEGQRGSVSSDQGGSSQGKDGPFPKVERKLEFDPTLGENAIKVFSRTLFVGGVTIPEDELHSLFSHHGIVQSCIVNHDKRHAFVKMLTRPDAERAKAAMEFYKADHVTLRTRWGVGFGPRDCSDYQTGISVIPIERLTDADHRWMAKAEYGGTGGEPIRGGMVVEEPDIEIGSGVSSKAISKRFPSSAASDGTGGHHPFGDKSGRGGRGGRGRGGKGNNFNQGQFNQQQQAQQQQFQFNPAMFAQFGQQPQQHQGQQNQQQNQEVHADPRAPVATGGVAPPTPGFGAGFPFAMPGWGQPQGR